MARCILTKNKPSRRSSDIVYLKYALRQFKVENGDHSLLFSQVKPSKREAFDKQLETHLRMRSVDITDVNLSESTFTNVLLIKATKFIINSLKIYIFMSQEINTNKCCQI